MKGKRALLFSFAVALVAAAVQAEPDRALARSVSSQRAEAAESRRLLALIDVEREETWHWQRVMGVVETRQVASERRIQSLTYRRWVLGLWRTRALEARKRANNPPRLASWLCIHRYEGPWHAHTGNGYYGGLQMDVEFQRTYGGRLFREKGTADHWTPLEQIWVAERAYKSGRGFYPWPNTARYCGLI